MTQIDCTENNILEGTVMYFKKIHYKITKMVLLKILAPNGCLQYYVESAGSIESFNFRMAMSPYPSELDYTICIRKQQGFCGVTLNTATADGGKIRSFLFYLILM